MSFLKSPHKIFGWVQLDGTSQVAAGDVIAPTKLDKLENLSNESVGHFRDRHHDHIVIVFAPAMRAHEVGYAWGFSRRHYTIWRKKPMLEKREWQNKPLPIP